jgi:hypothetical protein
MMMSPTTESTGRAFQLIIILVVAGKTRRQTGQDAKISR